MPANEGGTHGLYERMRSDGEIRRRTPMNAGSKRNLTSARAGRDLEASEGILKKPTDWFVAVPRSASELVDQLGRGPRRLTALVPFRQHGEGLFVVEREASRQPAADAERMNVAMLPRNGGRHGRQIPSCPLNYVRIASMPAPFSDK